MIIISTSLLSLHHLPLALKPCLALTMLTPRTPLHTQGPAMDEEQQQDRCPPHCGGEHQSCPTSTSTSNSPHSPPSHRRPRRRASSSSSSILLTAMLLSCSGGVTASSAARGWSGQTRHPSAFVVPSSSSPSSCFAATASSSLPLSLSHHRPRTALTTSIRRSRGRGDVRCSVDVGLALYDLQIWAKELVDTQLTHLTPVSGAVLYGAGLLTSLSPCALSLVPLTMAYLTDDGTDPTRSQKTLLFRAGMFTVGLATSLSVLGLSATLAGRLFGSAGAGALGAALPLTASGVAIVMGLNLLDLINLKLPSFEATLQLDKFPPSLQAFLLGATSALIASPCSTPVLASILGFVAASGEPYLGAGLLFSYSLGYSTPLLVAGVLSGAVTSFIAKRGDGFSWVTPATAVMLISYGTYSSLSTLFPPL